MKVVIGYFLALCLVAVGLFVMVFGTCQIIQEGIIEDKAFEHESIKYLVIPLESIESGEFEYKDIKYTITPYKELEWIEINKDVTLKGVI